MLIALPWASGLKGPSHKHHPAWAASMPREYIALRVPALFRSDRRRCLLDFRELRLETTFQHPVEAVEIEINHRRDVERQQLRHHKSAHHRHAERLAQFC